MKSIVAFLLLVAAGSVSLSASTRDDRPNILWIVTEDHSRDDVACYGNRDVRTPHIDGLAEKGVRFTNAFSAAPSCAPTRSGLITGMYPIRIGAQHQRNASAKLPDEVRLLPQHLKDAGYFCVNATWDFQQPGKKDYQFQWDPESTWEEALDWNARQPGQPFFAQIHIPEPHRSGLGTALDRVFKRDTEQPVDPGKIHLPPYYPDDPVVRIDFAQYLESVQMADRKLGAVLKKLEDDGLAEETVVFFFGDHGRPFPHGKQFLYDEGLAIPLIVRWPGEIEPGTVRKDLVSMVDFAPTVLRLAGLEVPQHMDGMAFLGDQTQQREFIFASRDRVDDAVDRIRCVRTKRYKYIRNFYPDKPYDMGETYMTMMHPTLAALRHWHQEDRLSPAQAKWMAPRRPKEELYDLEADPWETVNVATDPAHAGVLEKLREHLNGWLRETGDKGQYPESEASLEAIRDRYQQQLADRLAALGIERVDQLYDAWSRHLKPTQEVYEPTLESLASHPTPEWFKDAKFGIFIHWGVYSVPAFHEWYLVFMSPKSRFGRNLGGPPYHAAQGDLSDKAFDENIRQDANLYHRENYGVEFEYDEFIPMFKAENYDPEDWADLFERAGARYVVLTAKHGDEFALWPTKYTRRNAWEMGPQRDLAGDLAREVRAHGMKMGFYHNTTYSFWDERYPEREWVEYMNNSIRELVDLYQPDILWGDVKVGPVRDEDGKPLGADHWNSKETLAYFYNHSKNPDEVVANDRWDLDMRETSVVSARSLTESLWAPRAKNWNVEKGTLLGDFQTPERRNIPGIFEMTWETCDSLDPTSWGYSRQLPEERYLTANEVVDYLADVVSKGGNLLMNIGPRADGTIPEVMRDRLLSVGDWLSVNGESIYGTRPWSVYGEGPSAKEVGFSSRHRSKFKAGDVRFTQSKDSLYVIMLDWPDREIALDSLKEIRIKEVRMLGSDEILEWEKVDGKTTIFLPPNPLSPYANVLKIVLEG